MFLRAGAAACRKEGIDPMQTVEPIRRRYGEVICRACINEEYGAKLEPKDCLYGYTYTCPRCGKNRHLVSGFTMSGKLKMLFRR